MIDYRSDTVTQPTPEMKEAMQRAPLGDDVFGDDPTVNALEEKAAELFGMEAALFCPSGTMTNQIAIKVHTSPGDEVICDQLSHIYNYEGGGIAFNSGCSVKLLNGDRGRFTAEMVENSILPDDPHFPTSRLVSIENTCNKGGGVVWSNDEIQRIARLCDQHNLSFHLDGARLFNALINTKQDTLEVGQSFDSISICLSKGLGCPVGSLLLGNEAFIHQGRRIRKVFGGGMRQAGMLAAAGIYALDHNIDRLSQDHERAKVLESALINTPWVKEVLPVETNIVVAVLNDGEDERIYIRNLEEKGVRTVPFGKGRIRFVTHLDIDDQDIEQTLLALSKP